MGSEGGVARGAAPGPGRGLGREKREWAWPFLAALGAPEAEVAPVGGELAPEVGRAGEGFAVAGLAPDGAGEGLPLAGAGVTLWQEVVAEPLAAGVAKAAELWAAGLSPGWRARSKLILALVGFGYSGSVHLAMPGGAAGALGVAGQAGHAAVPARRRSRRRSDRWR